jgi:HK97 gp10 family phage protein
MSQMRTLGMWQAELAQSGAKARQEASQVVRAAAMLCQRTAVQLAPVDTGFLRSSITVGRPDGGSLRPGDLAAQVGPEANYGAFVEFGTSRAGAQPYMTPAAEQAGVWFTEAMRTQVGIR